MSIEYSLHGVNVITLKTKMICLISKKEFNS